jgi:hypothetical protein
VPDLDSILAYVKRPGQYGGLSYTAWVDAIAAEENQNMNKSLEDMTIEERVELAGAVFASDLSDLEDEPPPMPDLDTALARIAAENPAAAAAARAYLDRKHDALSEWVRLRVSPAEKGRLYAEAEAKGITFSDLAREKMGL